MGEAVVFPVYVLAKDCGEVTAFSSCELMQHQMEVIDVENDEYDAWDSDGRVLELSVANRKSEWLRIVKTEGRLSAEEFTRLQTKAKPYHG